MSVVVLEEVEIELDEDMLWYEANIGATSQGLCSGNYENSYEKELMDEMEVSAPGDARSW